MSTIPASYSVTVNPSVVAAGGSALDLNGLFLTTSSRVAIGTVLSLPTAAQVQDYFGGGTDEARAAAVYFAGFDGSNVKPGAMKFAQYPAEAVSAWLRGASVADLTLAELQGLSGLLSLSIDNTPKSATINLSAATSFTNAGQVIAEALGTTGPETFSGQGTIAATVLTVTVVTSGKIGVGDRISGADVTDGTYVASLGTGTGGVGTYNLTQSSTVAVAEAITANAPGCYFDSISGGFVLQSGTTGANSAITYASGALATSLLLTQASGAVLSQGAAAATPAAFMTALTLVDQNWAGFGTLFNPDAGDAITNRMAFALWTSQQNNRYAYAAWDTTAAPGTVDPATGSIGYALQQNNYSGTILVWVLNAASGIDKVAFILGAMASIDFTQIDGRITFAYKSQAGLEPDVTDLTTAINLGGNPLVTGSFGNGYNFYGAFATANQNFIDFQRGTISGPFQWIDSYVDQIWLTNQFQLDLRRLLSRERSIPYNEAGNAKIEAALADTIQQGLDFGMYRAGVELSASQIADVNADAGMNVATTLQNQGWYLKIGVANPTVRQSRGSPPMTFYYVDGQSVQALSLGSVALQ